MRECLSWAALLCHDALDELKIHHSERAIAPGQWSPADEFLAEVGGHHHAPGAQSHVDQIVQRRQEVR